MRCSRMLPSLLVLGCLAGCAGSQSGGTIKGTVTLDDQPLKEGRVRFEPVDGLSTTTEVDITDGTFTTVVPLGEMRVQFFAPKHTGRYTRMYPDAPAHEVIDELIPDHSNTNTKWRIKVENGTQEKSFSLTSQ